MLEPCLIAPNKQAVLRNGTSLSFHQEPNENGLGVHVLFVSPRSLLFGSSWMLKVYVFCCIIMVLLRSGGMFQSLMECGMKEYSKKLESEGY